MAVDNVRRQRRKTNHRSRRMALPFSTRLWRRVARIILENDTDQALDYESEDMSLELMVVTAPFSQIRANPMAWALFMRGYEVGRHFMTVGDPQQNHEQDLLAFQSVALWQNHLMSEESTPPVVMEVERGPLMQTMEAADIPAEMMLEEGSVEEMVTLPINDSLSPWRWEVLASMEEPQSTPTEVEQAHVPSANEDST